jgi:hypothetical protein
MTRKHFEDLANRLASLRQGHPESMLYPTMPMEAWEAMVREMANFCRSYNPRFDQDKFVQACRTR